MSALTIPELPDDVSTLDAALAYAASGWYVGPAKRGTKHPGSLLGTNWQLQTMRDSKLITATFAGTDHALFLHAGRSGAVVIDVDDESKLPGVAVRAERECRPPTQQTRPGRRHLIFVQPPGRDIGNSPGRLGDGWGEMRGRNGVIMAYPSTHPEGGEYRWLRAGSVPELPGYVAELLDDQGASEDAADDERVRAFLDQHVDEARPELLDILLSCVEEQLARKARHPLFVSWLTTAMKEAACGFYAAKVAADTLAAIFHAAEGKGPGRVRTRAEAVSEFASLLAWAVGQVNDVSITATRERVRKLDERTADGADDDDQLDDDDGHERAVELRASKLRVEREAQRRVDAEEREVDDSDTYASLLLSGGGFVFDGADEPAQLWGWADSPVWVSGESLLVCGPQGLGKTALAVQIMLGVAAVPSFESLLDMPIVPRGRVLYLAMDRPAQIKRSMRRMVEPEHRRLLDEQVTIRKGPPPRTVNADPLVLLKLAQACSADVVIVDSIKDAVARLIDDESGIAWNTARQHLLAHDIEVVELHHTRKTNGQASKSERSEPPTLDSIYGSTFITGGAGSVIVLSGAAGDPIVGLHHVKQPAVEVGPLLLLHDELTGRSSVFHQADLVALAAASPHGITAVDAAEALSDGRKPTQADKQRARRRLNMLVTSGQLIVFDKGDPATNRPDRWKEAK